MSFDDFKLDISQVIQKHAGKYPITFITKSGLVSGVVESSQKQDNFNNLNKSYMSEGERNPLAISLIAVQILNGNVERYFNHAVLFTDDIVSIAYDPVNLSNQED